MYKREEAVSPVIGVILMVAITVILAAVIAAFVFGLAGNAGSAKNVAVIFQANNTGGEFSWQGGTDLPRLTSWYAKRDGATVTPATSIIAMGTTVKVGDISYINQSVAGTRLQVIASFTDGKDTIIFDSKY